MSRHEASPPAPPLVVGVAVGTDTTMLIDELDTGVDDTEEAEDEEEAEEEADERAADETKEDAAVVVVVVDDTFDVVDVDET